MNLRIDAHAHVLLPGYAEALGPLVPPVPATLDGLNTMLDRYSIDRAILSTGPPGAPSANVARIANEELAELKRADPERFAVLATLPLGDVAAALQEIEVAYDDLDVDGVMLLSNVEGTYLGDRKLDPLFEALDRRGAYVFLHPGYPPHALPLEHHPVWLYEFPFETTRALANLIYSGTLERCPRVRLQAAHLGGAAPFLAHRLDSLSARQPEDAEAAPAGALAYLRRIFYDTGLSANPPALLATLAVAATDQIVFGTDWPYADLPDGPDPAPELAVLGEARAAADGMNVGALIPRWAA